MPIIFVDCELSSSHTFQLSSQHSEHYVRFFNTSECDSRLKNSGRSRHTHFPSLDHIDSAQKKEAPWFAQHHFLRLDDDRSHSVRGDYSFYPSRPDGSVFSRSETSFRNPSFLLDTVCSAFTSDALDWEETSSLACSPCGGFLHFMDWHGGDGDIFLAP